MRLPIIIMAAAALASCGEAETPKETKETAQPVADSPPPAPVPQYVSIDGDAYLYSAAISDAQKEQGQAAAAFLPFRYRGIKDGKITLTTDGMTATCDEDCKIITVKSDYGNKEYMAYEPASVIGAAFTDAMNGFLVERPSKAK